MHFAAAVFFCFYYGQVFGLDGDYADALWPQSTDKKTLKNANDELDLKQYQAELAAGDHSEFMGSNAHMEDPRYFKDLGRRFVPVYPYKNKVKSKKNEAEEIFKYIQSPKKGNDIDDGEIIPVRAPPEIVLAVMKKSKEMHTAKPSDPTEEVIRQYMLRSGDYWNDVVKEEVDPDFILRTSKHYNQKSLFQDSKPISAKLLPGTKLYKLLAEIVKKSPRLVYIINEK